MNSLTKTEPSQTKADEWFGPWQFAGILIALIVVCFPLVIFGFETFFFRDFGSFGYPLAFYHKESFWRGEIPFWNPYHECGLPFMAQWNTLVFYPPALFYLIFPLSWSLGVFNLAHLFLAGLGMYFLANRWTHNRFAASAAGLIFAFNGLTWHALMWPNNIAALGWMPWVVLTMQSACRRGGRSILKAALVATMQLLSGAPEIILLTWCFMGVFWLMDLLRAETPRVQLFLRFFFLWLLVAGLGAVQMLPFLDLLHYSQRAGNFFNSELWPMPLSGWANFFVPLFHEFYQKGVYSQYGQFWISSYYLGAAVMGLAAIAVFYRKQKVDWCLAGITLFCLVFALGRSGGLYLLIKSVLPGLSFLRYPIKVVSLPIFTIPLLAAFGLSWLAAVPEKQWPDAQKILKRIGIATLALIAGLCVLEWMHPLFQDDRLDTVRNGAVRVLFLVAILGTLFFLRRALDFKMQVLARLCLLLFFWFDVYTHENNPNPTVSRSVYEPDTIRGFFHWDKELQPGSSRALEDISSLRVIDAGAALDPIADVNGRRLALYADYNLLDHASKLNGFYSLELREMSMLINGMFAFSNALPRLNDFIGIEKISNPTNAVDWVTRTNFMPMITAGQEPLFAGDESLMRLLVSDKFDPQQVVYLPPEWCGKVRARHTQTKIQPPIIGSRKITVEVTAEASAMVVIAQAFHHNWHAYVDGKRIPLFRANFAFEALEVPAGIHQISLVYEDRAFQIGSIISALSLATTGFAWRFTKRTA